MKYRAMGLVGVVLAALVTGCSRDRTADITLLTRASVAAPQPPLLMTTGAALLLTNVPGFSARAEIQGLVFSGSGMLFGREGKLLFQPEPEEVDKNVPEGRYSFIWDVSRSQGWLLSDALQGYAPVSLSGMGTATNISISRDPTSERSQATAHMTDGKQVHFSVSFASEGNNFPALIQGTDPAFKASLSRISFRAPPAASFELPRGFTAYGSPEALVDEMSARFRNLNRRHY